MVGADSTFSRAQEVKANWKCGHSPRGQEGALAAAGAAPGAGWVGLPEGEEGAGAGAGQLTGAGGHLPQG